MLKVSRSKLPFEIRSGTEIDLWKILDNPNLGSKAGKSKSQGDWNAKFLPKPGHIRISDSIFLNNILILITYMRWYHLYGIKVIRYIIFTPKEKCQDQKLNFVPENGTVSIVYGFKIGIFSLLTLDISTFHMKK